MKREGEGRKGKKMGESGERELRKPPEGKLRREKKEGEKKERRNQERETEEERHEDKNKKGKGRVERHEGGTVSFGG